MRITLLVAASVVLARLTAYSGESEAHPNQELGTVVYFVPAQHADADMAAHAHGFVALLLQQTDENNIKPTFVAHSAAEFVSRYQRIPRELQQYGVWLTLQEGDPYTPDEKAMLEELKALCSKHKIPLSIHTGREDKGWQRFSCMPHERSNHAMERTADRSALRS
jgi:hypothetical protein